MNGWEIGLLVSAVVFVVFCVVLVYAMCVASARADRYRYYDG
jgi:hypothetical protein